MKIMNTGTLTWDEFLTESVKFKEIAQGLGDDWQIYKKNDDVGSSYLIFKQKIIVPHQSDECDNNAVPGKIYQVEYHIVYNMAYEVPMLLLELHTDDGQIVSLEDSWDIFFNCDSGAQSMDRSVLLQTLTQWDHPVLFKPFLALHPCRTAEILAQAGPSSNRIITFISVMGPYVKLNLSNEYGLECSDNGQMPSGCDANCV